SKYGTAASLSSRHLCWILSSAGAVNSSGTQGMGPGSHIGVRRCDRARALSAPEHEALHRCSEDVPPGDPGGVALRHRLDRVESHLGAGAESDAAVVLTRAVD